ncbi:hypothetical protein E2C01_038122 [Portunus trituberculatus]|uniref:Uncharacterized protein n=1 Tax=Portunus trituberculatus TaxID=210409 RepID=A0A5B7FGS4_PORTR|nr:hypothetical protein [Portunus trituberculatus]
MHFQAEPSESTEGYINMLQQKSQVPPECVEFEDSAAQLRTGCSESSRCFLLHWVLARCCSVHRPSAGDTCAQCCVPLTTIKKTGLYMKLTLLP